MDDGRNRQVNFRLTEDQYETFRSKAALAGLSMTDYFMACCIDGKTTFRLLKVPGIPVERDQNPPKGFDDREKRTASIFVRVTPSEKKFIRDSAARAGMTESRFVVTRTVNAPIRFIGDPEFFRSFFTELNRQGTNLNQLAAQVNRLSAIGWREDVSAEAIDALVSDITRDNERTRAMLNDALMRTRELMMFVRKSFEEPDHGDA